MSSISLAVQKFLKGSAALPLALVLYLAAYAVSTCTDPMLGDDSPMGFTTREPNFIIPDQEESATTGPYSFDAQASLADGLYAGYNTSVFASVGDHRIPVLFQDRQGGLPFYFVRELARMTSPIVAMNLYNVGTALLTLLFMWLGISRFRDRSVASLATLLLATSPLILSPYGPLFSEKVLPLLFWMCFTFIQGESRRERIAAALCISAGVFVKITFLWQLAILVVLFRKNFLKGWQTILPVAAVASLPHLIILLRFDLLRSILEETQASCHLDGVDPAIATMRLGSMLGRLFLDIFNFISAPNLSGICYFDNSACPSWYAPVTLPKLSVAQLLAALASLAFFLAPGFRLGKEDSRSRYLSLYASIALYFALVFLSLPGRNTYSYYLDSLYGIILLIVAQSMIDVSRELWKRRRHVVLTLVSIFAAAHLYSLITHLVDYRERGPIAQVSMKFHQGIANDLLKRGITRPIQISYGDAGYLEFLSEERIRPINIWETVTTKNISSVHEIVGRFRAGTLLLGMETAWMEACDFVAYKKNLNPEAELRKIREMGYTVSDSRFYEYRGKPIIWALTFARP